jgi:hypothetical protein
MRQVLKEKGRRHAALTRGFCLPSVRNGVHAPLSI